MILMVDNYDSFTYNLVQYLAMLGETPHVIRNDALDVAGVEALDPEAVILSPGPGTPEQAGVCVPLVRALSGRVPIFGVCLGLQCLGAAFGARIVHARKVCHGKVSEIHHRGQGAFQGLRSPLTATRYHSLALEASSLPEDLEITAWTDDREIMGIQHRTHPTSGVQFHPESILTPAGKRLLKNVLKQARRDRL